jgi:hypothetical protein
LGKGHVATKFVFALELTPSNIPMVNSEVDKHFVKTRSQIPQSHCLVGASASQQRAIIAAN